ncbi:MAG TPA: pyridoxamine 5'-phosphate oxidase family protein [Patescibacteria group bacterium]|nr:pyridoxamine 5'-phosphate oxidase family protein [Patescibacteria group bacterium]
MIEQKVRYQQRNCTDQEKIEAFLLRSRVGVLGMTGEMFPYAVPVNYVWHHGAFYFHGMGSGKKEELLNSDPPVCVTIYEERGTVIDPVPCHADTAYMSVMIFGRTEKVRDFSEAAGVLQLIVEKYLPDFYSQPLSGTLVEKYRSGHDGKGVSVYRVVPQQLTAKENTADGEQIFQQMKPMSDPK